MGVSMLPRFAATVSSVISGTRSFCLFERLRIIIENGTHAIRATIDEALKCKETGCERKHL